MLLFLFIIGILVGTVSGMLGIGGGILMTPILLYLPSLFGFPTLSMKTITGLTMVQGLVGSASGYVSHRRFHQINKSLIYWMAPFMAISSFIGAHFSSELPNNILLAIFATLALVASILIFINKTELEGEVENFNPFIAVSIASIVGFTGGLVGQGGSFLIVPAMIAILKIPTRIALGSNLGIVLIGSIAGILGKWSGGMIEPMYALVLIAGVIPGAQLGGYLSQHIKQASLKKTLFAIIFITSINMWWSIF